MMKEDYQRDAAPDGPALIARLALVTLPLCIAMTLRVPFCSQVLRMHTILPPIWPLGLLAGLRFTKVKTQADSCGGFPFRAIGAVHSAVAALALFCMVLRGCRSGCFRTMQAVLHWHGVALQALITALPLAQAPSHQIVPLPCFHALLRLACSAVALRLGYATVEALKSQAVTSPGPARLEPFIQMAADASPFPRFPPSLPPAITPAVTGSGECVAGGGDRPADAAGMQAAAAGGCMDPAECSGTDEDAQLMLAAGVGGLAAWIFDLVLTAASVRLRRALLQVARAPGAQDPSGGRPFVAEGMRQRIAVPAEPGEQEVAAAAMAGTSTGTGRAVSHPAGGLSASTAAGPTPPPASKFTSRVTPVLSFPYEVRLRPGETQAGLSSVSAAVVERAASASSVRGGDPSGMQPPQTPTSTPAAEPQASVEPWQHSHGSEVKHAAVQSSFTLIERCEKLEPSLALSDCMQDGRSRGGQQRQLLSSDASGFEAGDAQPMVAAATGLGSCRLSFSEGAAAPCQGAQPCHAGDGADGADCPCPGGPAEMGYVAGRRAPTTGAAEMPAATPGSELEAAQAPPKQAPQQPRPPEAASGGPVAAGAEQPCQYTGADGAGGAKASEVQGAHLPVQLEVDSRPELAAAAEGPQWVPSLQGCATGIQTAASAAVSEHGTEARGRPAVLYASPVRHVTVVYKLEVPPEVAYERVATCLTAAAHSAVDAVMSGGAAEAAPSGAAAAPPTQTSPSGSGAPCRWLGYVTQVHCLQGCVEVILRLQYEGGQLTEEELATAVMELERELRQRAAACGAVEGRATERAAGMASPLLAAGSSSGTTGSVAGAAAIEAQHPIIVLQHPPAAPAQAAPGPQAAPTAATLGPGGLTAHQFLPPQGQIANQSGGAVAATVPDIAPGLEIATEPRTAAADDRSGSGSGKLGWEAMARFAPALPLLAYMHPPVLAATASTPFGTASDFSSAGLAVGTGAAFGCAPSTSVPEAIMGWFGGDKTLPLAVGAPQVAAYRTDRGIARSGALPLGWQPSIQPWSSADCSTFCPPSSCPSGDGGPGGGGPVGEVSSGAATDSNRSSEPGLPHSFFSAGAGASAGNRHRRSSKMGRVLAAISHLDTPGAFHQEPLGVAVAAPSAVTPQGAAAGREAEPTGKQRPRAASVPLPGPARYANDSSNDSSAGTPSVGARPSMGSRSPARHRRRPQRGRTLDAAQFAARGLGGGDGDGASRSSSCRPRAAPAVWEHRQLDRSLSGGISWTAHQPLGPAAGAAEDLGAALPAAAAGVLPRTVASEGTATQLAQRARAGSEAAQEQARQLVPSGPAAAAETGGAGAAAPAGVFGATSSVESQAVMHPPTARARRRHSVLDKEEQEHSHSSRSLDSHPFSLHHQHQRQGHQSRHRAANRQHAELPAPTSPPSSLPRSQSLPPPTWLHRSGVERPAPDSPPQQWLLRPPEAVYPEGVFAEGSSEREPSSMMPPHCRSGSFTSCRSKTAAGGTGVRIDLFFDRDITAADGTDAASGGSGSSDGSLSSTAGGGSASGRGNSAGEPLLAQQGVERRPACSSPSPPPPHASVDVRVVVKQHGTVVAEVERLTVGLRGASVRLDLSGLEQGSAALLVLPCRRQQQQQQQGFIAAESPAAALLYTPIAIVPPAVASELRALMHEMQRAAILGPRRADPRIARARAFTHHFCALVSDIVSLLLGCERVAEEAEEQADAAAAALTRDGPVLAASDGASALSRHQEELRELSIGVVSYLIGMGLTATVRYLLEEVQDAGVQIRSGELVGEEVIRHILGQGVAPEGPRQPQPQQLPRGPATIAAASDAEGKAGQGTEAAAGPAVETSMQGAIALDPVAALHGHQLQRDASSITPLAGSVEASVLAAPHQDPLSVNEEVPELSTPSMSGAEHSPVAVGSDSGSLSMAGSDRVDASRSEHRGSSWLDTAANQLNGPTRAQLRDVLRGFEPLQVEHLYEAFLSGRPTSLERAAAAVVHSLTLLTVALMATVAGWQAMSTLLLGGVRVAERADDGAWRGGGDGPGIGAGGGGASISNVLYMSGSSGRAAWKLLPQQVFMVQMAVVTLGATIVMLGLPTPVRKVLRTRTTFDASESHRRREAAVRVVHLVAMVLLLACVWVVPQRLGGAVQAWAAYAMAAVLAVLQPAVGNVRFASSGICWTVDGLVLVTLGVECLSAVGSSVVGDGGGHTSSGNRSARIWDSEVSVALPAMAAAAGLLATSQALAAWLDLQSRRRFVRHLGRHRA